MKFILLFLLSFSVFADYSKIEKELETLEEGEELIYNDEDGKILYIKDSELEEFGLEDNK